MHIDWWIFVTAFISTLDWNGVLKAIRILLTWVAENYISGQKKTSCHETKYANEGQQYHSKERIDIYLPDGI